jgi:ABC-type nitrate/sulfonate/bicarbonate transport system substrate-binding protein
MNRRSFVRTSTAIGTTMLLPPGIGRALAAPETTSLAMGFGLDPVFAPHIVAMEKGWLEEAGFTEVETRSFTGGALAGEALLSGDIQLWTPGNLPPISMAHNDIPIVVLGTNCIASAADKLVARADAEIRAPEDLYDIEIGLLAGSTASAFLHNLARHYGLDESRLTVVNMPPPEQLSSLNSGAVQAMICWEPWGHNAASSEVGELIHTGEVSHFEANRGEPVRVSTTRSLFVASQEFVRANPEATHLLMQTLVRAQRYVADPANWAEVLPLIAETTRQEPALVEAIWDEYVFDPTVDQAYVDDMAQMTEFLVASGRAAAALDPLGYTYTGAVASADPALVQVEGGWTP